MPLNELLLIEQTAMQLYQDALRQMPKLNAAKHPRWTELGVDLRNSYRAAVKQLLSEY